MKVTQENVKALQQLAASSKYNKELINDVIQLYKDRKIERFDTARTIIDGLASRGPAKRSKAMHKLNFYQNEYMPRRILRQLDQHLPKGINRYIKLKGLPPEELAKISNGDMHTVKSYVKLEFIKHYIRGTWW